MATQEEAKAQAKQFAKDLIKRSRDFADEFTEEIYGDAPRPMQGEALISLLRTNMWREYMLGCQAPAKLMTLISDEHVDLKYLLAGQVADEMRHSQTFKARVEQLGGDGKLLHYEPTEEDWQLYYSTVDFDDPAELVASLNCTGEVVLQQTLKRLAERREGQPAVLDDETADIIERDRLRRRGRGVELCRRRGDSPGPTGERDPRRRGTRQDRTPYFAALRDDARDTSTLRRDPEAQVRGAHRVPWPVDG